MEEPTAVAPDGPPTTTTVASTNVAVVPKISPSVTSSSNADNQDPTPLEFDPSLSEDERRFYVKAYPTIDLVRERRVHCTTCKVHIGTAPTQESNIKMHPELRVTHCNKCHDFYNSGEFSKGEDGSELYCRWCGQGGEVYCCSNCAYVFCKSCIVKNLSRGVVSDIEQNENWSCFSCAPKILWPLRAQHWALINYIEKQKKNIQSMNLPDQEMRQLMSKDLSTCCRLAKAKCGNMSDSLESLDSATSRRSLNSAGSAKKAPKSHGGSASQSPSAKRAKPNDEVVCTPDLMSMLEPDCQITMSPKPRSVQSPATAAPRVMSLQAGGGGGYPQSSTPKNSAPPPLVLRNTGIQMRPVAPIVRRTVIGPRPAPNAGIGSPAAPVYHTINGYRIDLNSAAQQETFRLPNGKLIQVKRQGTQNPTPSSPTTVNNWPQQRQVTPSMHSRPAQIAQSTSKQYQAHITLQPQSSGHHLPQQHPQMIRYHNTMVGHTTVTPMNHNGGGGAQIHVINGGAASNPNPPMQQQQQQQAQLSGATVRPLMVRHVFPDTAIGQARTQLQDQVFNAMEICQHLTGKVQTLTNSNAYKQARNYLEVKELYIHLSYLLTYAIGRFKGLQDKCLGDMRQLGFVNDADSLENGQLAADKQASDDEDNEIEIVEPQTDTITLDSDNDDEEPTRDTKPTLPTTAKITTAVAVPAPVMPAIASVASAHPINAIDDHTDFMSANQLFLASMLEVDLSEGDQPIAQSSPGGSDTTQKKQPRKKTTHKPNPTLLKQKELLERERLEEMKRSDAKLKMKCAIELKKAEDEYPFAKEMLDEKEAEKKLKLEEKKKEISTTVKSTDEPSALVEVEVMLVDDLDSSTEASVPKEASSNTANTDKKKVEEKIVDTVVIEVVVEGDSKEKEKPAIEGKESKEENVKLKDSKEEGESVVKVLSEDTEIVKEIRKEENLIPEKIEEDKKVAADGKEKEVSKKDIDKKEDNTITETATKDQNAEESVGKDVEMKELNTLDTEKSPETDTAQDENEITEPVEQNQKDVDMIEPIEQIEESIDEIENTTIDETLDGSLAAKEASAGEAEIVEKMVKTDGEEVDVDKEIEKLLQNSKNSTNEHKSEEIMLSTMNIADLPSEKQIIAITADTNLSAEATSASPDLFNDINELIEKENNAMT